MALNRIAGWCAAIALTTVASVAFAEATVTVQVRAAQGAAPQGTVRLVTSGAASRTFSCHTSNNACTLAGVPGGMHNVTFSPDGGGSETARSVMVPPSGTVTLIVNIAR